MIFPEARRGKLSVLPNFQISKSHSVFEIWTHISACELNSIEVQTLKCNMGPKSTPSLISKAWKGINTPLEVGLMFPWIALKHQ